MPWPAETYDCALRLRAGVLPVGLFHLMGTRLVAPGHELRPARSDLLHRCGDVLAAANARRVRFRTDDDEVVVHDVLAHRAVTRRHELVLERTRVDEQHVGVAVLAELERRAGADRDHPDLGAVLRLELRQDLREETGVFGAGGGREADIVRCLQPVRRRPGMRRDTRESDRVVGRHVSCAPLRVEEWTLGSMVSASELQPAAPEERVDRAPKTNATPTFQTVSAATV